MIQTQATDSFADTAKRRWTHIRSAISSGEIGYGLLLILIGALLGRFLLFPQDAGYNTNLYTEALSVILTILVLDRLADRRSEKELKESLLARAKSRNNAVASGAIDEIRARGWLTGEDGLLKGAVLHDANLEKVNLRAANLAGADLWEANLAEANLMYANLADAEMEQANLTHASVEEANLSGGNFEKANLAGASLGGANLVGAYLLDANLDDALFWGAIFEKDGEKKYLGTCTLADGSEWTEEMDLARFTNADHSQYEATLAKINALRLQQGKLLFDILYRLDTPRHLCPLPGGERLELNAMYDRVNARRRELGLEALQ